jgi:phasin family protein
MQHFQLDFAGAANYIRFSRVGFVFENAPSEKQNIQPDQEIVMAKAASVDTAAFTETVEKMTSASTDAMRKGFDKSYSAFTDMSEMSKKNLEALTASASVATKGMESLNAKVLAYTKSSMESGIAAARSLGSAQSVQEAIELQTKYAKSAFEAYMAELNAMSEMMVSTAKSAAEPLNAQFSSVVTTLQKKA